MTKKEKASKGQISKEVRRVLARYQVDFTYIHFSAGMHSIHLSGYLIKASGHNFQASVVQSLTNELLRIGSIRCELENWYIGAEGVHYTGKEEDENKEAS